MHAPGLGAATLAHDFLLAATKVQSPAKSELEALRQKPSLVAYYLAAHSVELALKSFLLVRGVSAHDLRGRAYGHNLAALLAASRKRRLGLVVKLSERELRIIRLMNDMYSAKELEYRYGGPRVLPPYAELVHTAERLCNGAHGFAAGAS
jgi:hypothetical protein